MFIKQVNIMMMMMVLQLLLKDTKVKEANTNTDIKNDQKAMIKNIEIMIIVIDDPVMVVNQKNAGHVVEVEV
jgi:hypothetical protein